MKNLLLFLGFLSLSLAVVSCNDDDDDDHDHDENMITIEFKEPTNEEVVADPSDVHVHIDITATGEVHDLEIKLHPEGDVNDLIIDHDEHSHESEVTFETDVNLSDYPAGTEFHIEVKVAKDHDGTEFHEEDIHFKIP